jgi:hypothetical protein
MNKFIFNENNTLENTRRESSKKISKVIPKKPTIDILENIIHKIYPFEESNETYEDTRIVSERYIDHKKYENTKKN